MGPFPTIARLIESSTVLPHLITLLQTVSAGHKQAMRKMDPATGLKERLTNFLLVYSSIPRATAGMRSDELFLRRVQTHFSLLSPNLSPRVEGGASSKTKGLS